MYDLQELTNTYSDLKVVLAKLGGQRDLLSQNIEELSIELAKTDIDSDIFEKARIFLQRVSEAAREVAKVQIETIVTSALQYVFGANYSFKVELRHTNTGPLADFIVVTKYENRTVENLPITGKGGGVIDILAVALKFSLLELLKIDGPIWLDEPFKHVSEDYIQATGKLLTFIGETSGRQINIITHNPRLAELCTKSINVTQSAGFSSAL